MFLHARALLISLLRLLEVNRPFLARVAMRAVLERPKEELLVLVELGDASF
jgi:hypothetical protein